MFLATAAQPKTKSRSTKVEKEPRQPISAWSGLAMSGLFCCAAWASRSSASIKRVKRKREYFSLGADLVLFFYLTAPERAFQKSTKVCNRILLTAFVLAFRVPVFTSWS
jgi:hypothetical protein